MTISLTHYDLDGISSQILLSKIFNIQFKFNSSYENINSKLDEIENLVLSRNIKRVIISDLALKKDNLIKLEKIIKINPNIEFYIFDHHDIDIYFLSYLKENYNIIFELDSNKSSTKIIFEKYENYLKESLKNDIFNNLKDYVSNVNSYDLWLTNEPNFKFGMLLNELFWYSGDSVFFTTLNQNNFKIPDFFKSRYEKIVKDKDEYFEILENNKLIFKDFENQNILIVFCSKYKNFISLDYESEIYIIIDRKYITIKSKNTNIKKILKDFLNSYSGIDLWGGHNFILSIKSELFLDKDYVSKFIKNLKMYI